MGCDIHTFVEYREVIENYPYSKTWRPLGGDIRLWRDYEIFSRIGNHTRGDEKMLDLKGIPEDLGYQADSNWWLYVTKDKGEDCTTLASAKRYEKMGSRVKLNAQGEIERVEHPDWHSPTWLTINEFKMVLEDFKGIDDYQAVLAMMESLESNGKEVRLVVWFDN